MNVVVTGGSGFIGRAVVAQLLKGGHAVRVLSRSGAGAPKDAEAVAHDLRNRAGLADALRGMDAVIHCAAAMGGSLEAQLADTVEGTRHLLSAMVEAGVRRIVGLSTFAVYDCLRIPEDAVLDEQSPLEENYADRGPYILAKRRQEELIRAQAAGDGWSVALVRPGLVFGPGRTWFYHLGAQLSSTRWVSFAGASLLPLTHVDHCAEAIVLALGDGAAGGTFNIVDDDVPSRAWYMEALARRQTPRPAIHDVPWALLKMAARTAGGINRVLLGKAPLPGLLRPSDVHARCKPLRYSNERAKTVLGWKPRRGVAEALERSLA